MDKEARIYVAGHRGMVGSALVRELDAHGYRNIITRTHAELDLTDQHAVNAFFHDARVDIVLLAAARVGGILANATQPARFLYENLAIETNVIHAAYRAQVARLVFFGSSCIYPKLCRSRFARSICSARRSSRPTMPMPSPRSPVSRCATPTTANTARITFR